MSGMSPHEMKGAASSVMADAEILAYAQTGAATNAERGCNTPMTRSRRSSAKSALRITLLESRSRHWHNIQLCPVRCDHF
jgi:hypothetical protein